MISYDGSGGYVMRLIEKGTRAGDLNVIRDCTEDIDDGAISEFLTC